MVWCWLDGVGREIVGHLVQMDPVQWWWWQEVVVGTVCGEVCSVGWRLVRCGLFVLSDWEH